MGQQSTSKRVNERESERVESREKVCNCCFLINEFRSSLPTTKHTHTHTFTFCSVYNKSQKSKYEIATIGVNLRYCSIIFKRKNINKINAFFSKKKKKKKKKPFFNQKKKKKKKKKS